MASVKMPVVPSTDLLSKNKIAHASQEGSKKGKNTQKTIEERYKKKTPIEHILHRPESYVGSVQEESQSLWIWNDTKKVMEHRVVTFVPGLYKIFDEILVNAADVKAREDNETSRTKYSQKITYIKVDINQTSGVISVSNDGSGIPIEIHKEHNVYVPELIFGHLLTSDNYDDTEARVTGGRNGYGAKLTNIFSKSFVIECTDSSRKRKFTKTWTNNMSESHPHNIVDYKESKDYVKVTFQPDLPRFGLRKLEDDFVALLVKRVYDVAGCCAVKVWLNGERLPVDNFKSYVNLYLNNDNQTVKSSSDEESKQIIKIHEKVDRWEVVLTMSEENQFQQVSFVNSVCTLKGGTHVNYVIDPLVQAILKKISIKNKGGLELKSHHIKAHIWIFLNCLIVNPTFDSQTKETLTSKSINFGSKFVLSEKTINAVMKSEIIESILMWAKAKQQVEFQKKMKGSLGRGGRERISGIPKLEDANDAGTKYSENCTLILTEGESAKTSCIAGLSVVGRDRYGIFPLRGKLLNVREASFKQQIENQEIQAILKIMGLQVGKKIDSPKGLRYGSLMIMTDQDFDGSHIKGLLLNMVAHYWPDLLKYHGFLRQFVTPIVKVSCRNQTISFFTVAEYEEWRKENDNGNGWKIKYYKGLGTSTDKEFKEYFTRIKDHCLDFVYKGEEDLQAIDMAFNSKRAEDRKQWIQSYEEGTYIDHKQSSLSYSDFINKELVQFSKYDVFRSIPNCVDGLKPVQRKVLYAAFKKNLKTELKVAQFTGYISEKTSYHHGEQSLAATIIGMAQNFVGSNNLNLLVPCGQFGSRKEGGKDCSAVRYIFTYLSPLARAIFPESDDPLLEYQNDDGTFVEPKYYVPIIPLVLLNGVEGIGTGWSSSIPNYHYKDLIDNTRRFIHGRPMEPMTPWYRGFKGTIEPKPGGFESVGIIDELDDETVVIKELPVKVWTQNYKQFLEELLQPNVPPVSSSNANAQRDGGEGNSRSTRARAFTSNTQIMIQDYRDNSTHESVFFTVKLSPNEMDKARREGLEKAFKLRKPISTTNMTLFDPNTKVQKYATELDIIREYGQIRLQYYVLRRSYYIEKMQRDCKILENKIRFIQEIINKKIIINNRKKTDIIKDLVSNNYDAITKIHREAVLMWKIEHENNYNVKEEDNPDEDQEETVVDESENEHSLYGYIDFNIPVLNQPEKTNSYRIKVTPKEFEYLLGMPLWNLTYEKITEIKKQQETKLNELKKYESKTPEDLWEDDLTNLEEVIKNEIRNTEKHDSVENIQVNFLKNKKRDRAAKKPASKSTASYKDQFSFPTFMGKETTNKEKKKKSPEPKNTDTNDMWNALQKETLSSTTEDDTNSTSKTVKDKHTSSNKPLPELLARVTDRINQRSKANESHDIPSDNQSDNKSIQNQLDEVATSNFTSLLDVSIPKLNKKRLVKKGQSETSSESNSNASRPIPKKKKPHHILDFNDDEENEV